MLPSEEEFELLPVELLLSLGLLSSPSLSESPGPPPPPPPPEAAILLPEVAELDEAFSSSAGWFDGPARSSRLFILGAVNEVAIVGDCAAVESDRSLRAINRVKYQSQDKLINMD